MSLSAGSRLGTCEIVSLLGSGGMGEVYRARDTRLGRDVAIKVLPDAFTLDADRLTRFQREAQLLAALNHANVAAIYGVEESSGVHALILELVEGPTLAERIALGPVPIDEALPIARQVAEALEAAHEQGIVHRDLKPANIKVRPDGTVKVLDFGLAKIVETATPSASGLTGLSQSPTLTSPALTRLGLILGTAAYMAPEQAKGQPADRRSDVWAFGCVLFEMLAGKRAFGGEDVADTLAAVLRADPDWSALPADAVSVSVRPLLERCLRKEARKRLPHIGAARLDLDDALARLEKPDQPVVSTHDETRWRGRIGWIAAAAAIAAAGVLAVPAITHWREQEPIVAPEMRLEIATPSTAFANSFALSPDGRYVVHSAFTDGTSQLWLRAMDTGISRVLQGTEGARNPFWSADGRSIGFFARSMVNRIDLAGGVPRALAPAVPGLGGAWNVDGVILFGSGAPGALQRVSASGGAPTSATKLADGDSVHVHPSFLPDQRQFVVLVNGRRPGLYLGSLDSPDLKWLTESDSGALFRAPGWLLFVRDGALVARRFDRVKQVVIGEPIVVANQINATRATLADLPFSVSTTGLLAFRGRDSSRRQLVWVDRAGKRLGEATAALDDDIMNPEISPDGRRIAAELSRESNQDIWVFDGPRGSRPTLHATHFRSGRTMARASCSARSGPDEMLFSKSLPTAVGRRPGLKVPPTGPCRTTSRVMADLSPISLSIPKREKTLGCCR
jgi:serine/threonine protein kinase